VLLQSACPTKEEPPVADNNNDVATTNSNIDNQIEPKRMDANNVVNNLNTGGPQLDPTTMSFINSIITLVTSHQSNAATIAARNAERENDEGWVRVPSSTRREGNKRGRNHSNDQRAANFRQSGQEHHHSHGSASKRPRQDSYNNRKEVTINAEKAATTVDHRPPGEIVYPADILGAGDSPRVNIHQDESFHQAHFTPQQWERRLEGVNKGTDCLFCGHAHWSDECPLYPQAKYRRAIFRKHNRCTCCKGYHFPLLCWTSRQRNICTFLQCREEGLHHDRLFCEVTTKERDRANGKEMPIGYDIRRAPIPIIP